jgi:hypothetical protein
VGEEKVLHEARGPRGSPRPDLVSSLAEFLATPDPKFFLIVGKIGSGKSTLLRALIPSLSDPKLFLAYQSIGPPDPSRRSPGAASPPVSMLLIEPARERPDDAPRTHSPVGPSSLAFSPQQDADEPSATAGPLVDAVARLVEAGGGSIVADSWDRGTETHFRSQAGPHGDATTLRAPAGALTEMQSAILSTPIRLLLAATPELGEPLLSMADAVVTLREEARGAGRLRIATVAKIRGHHQPPPDHLYTLAEGRFYSLPALPLGFRPPTAPPDPDPEPEADSAWPGSSEFAGALGRLRYGGLTAITLSPDCPDTIPHALVAPVALHALRTGGRVVWIPAPSIRPSQVVQALRTILPDDTIRERLRILAASGDDPSMGDLRTVILPLTRGTPGDPPGSTGSAPGVRALFPEVHRFFRDREEGTAVIMVGSFEGLRAAAAAAGVAIDATTIPVVLGTYAKLPRFHLFGYCDRTDPVVPHLRPGVDSLAELDIVHGRPVLLGIRPTTTPFLVDWPDPGGPFRLVPVL